MRVLVMGRIYIHAKGQGQRSKVKIKKVTTQLNRFRTVTLIWIHMWWWNDTYSLILLRRGALLFLAATKQLYKWYFLSVCRSVCHTFLTMFSPCSHHHIIMKFSGVITMDRSEVHAKYQGQRSKVKVTEVNTQLSRFRTLNFEFTYSNEIVHTAGSSIEEVTYCLSRSSVKF